MRKLILLLACLAFIPSFGQSIEELEERLMFGRNGGIDSIRVISDKIFALDPYNETAVYLMLDAYAYESKFALDLKFDPETNSAELDTGMNYLDSMRVFFDQMIALDPLSPEPWVLKAKYHEYAGWDFEDKIQFLEKAVSLDPNHLEAHYLLGEAYYWQFQQAYCLTPKNLELEKNAGKAFQHFMIVNQNDSIRSHVVSYPLTQLAHYLGADTGLMILSGYECFFPIGSLANLPDDWERNPSYDVLSEIERAQMTAGGYSYGLKSMKEPLIYKNPDKQEVFRFSWFRSFHPPIVVRMERKADRVLLSWKRATGAYDSYWNLTVDASKEIALEEMESLKLQAETTGFWEMPTPNKELGLDGAEWILEAKIGGRYHVVDRWSPDGSPFTKLCLYLLELTDLEIDEKDVY